MFNELVSKIGVCKKCLRMKEREGVIGLQCGSLDSKILFIGEAPGRLGADITKIPFSGDQTGDNFEKLVKSIGWNRKIFFITNSVLCNPRDENGNNSRPLDSEIKNCFLFLLELLDIIKPKIIVTLGEKALKSLYYIKKHNIVLKKGVAIPTQWNDYIVFPLYHCSPKAFIHRKIELQIEDYQVLNAFCNRENII